MICFSTGKLRKNTCFEPMRSLFSFSTAQTEKNLWKKFVKQIGEIIWRIRYKITNSQLETIERKGQGGRRKIARSQIIFKWFGKNQSYKLWYSGLQKWSQKQYVVYWIFSSKSGVYAYLAQSPLFGVGTYMLLNFKRDFFSIQINSFSS